MKVRAITATDRPALSGLVESLWGADIVVGHGTVFRPAELPGFLAEDGAEVVGVLTYARPSPDTLEVVTIDALRRHEGVGSALLDAAVTVATELGARQVVLTTTNDNVDAVRFYQRRGFRLTALRPGVLTESRLLKPRIPLIGAYGIPLTDELDLTRPL